MRQSGVAFYCKKLLLDGILASPQGLPGPFPGAVVCHPHPLFGGDMENAVVVAISRALVQAGFIVLRFNFRGVGSSEGEHGKGEAEVEDVQSALDFLRRWQGIAPDRLAVAGYSFGAAVALLGLGKLKQAKAFAFVSPTPKAMEQAPLEREKRPKLFVVGEQDRLATPSRLRELAGKAAQPSEFVVLADADHSWYGHEERVGEAVAGFLRRHLRTKG